MLVALGAGCAAAPPPVMPPAPPPAEPAAPPAPPDPAPPEKEPELPALAKRAAPPPIDEALPPLTRTFANVRIAGVKDPFIAVGGRSAREVLFLTEEGHRPRHRGIFVVGTGILYRTDGERVVERMEPCGEYSFGSIAASRDEILLAGSNLYFRGVPGGLWASFAAPAPGKRAEWDCSSQFARGSALSSGGRVWRLACTYGPCVIEASGAPPVRPPTIASPRDPRGSVESVTAFWMRAPDDGWAVQDEGDNRYALFRYNGVSWTKRASLDDLEPWDMWVDGEDHVWILARRGAPVPSGSSSRDRTSANVVLRLDGRALTELRLPRDFEATSLRATGPSDIWFLGHGRAVFQWDGQRLRRGEAPFPASNAWAAPGGEVWIIGDGKPGSAWRTTPPAGGRG
jgi:hypothetical protein